MDGQERRGRILVVDDEEPVRRALAQILEDEGYEVVGAESAEEGIKRAAECAPDAIFLDIWLPGIDGIEALKHLRERGVAAPVVMISGHGTIETAVKATKLGAYDFVEKPVSLDRVLVVAANALRHARLERRNRALSAELRREAEFVGKSARVERLRRELAGAADGRPVLLHGEKGTGRRLAARWLSLHSLHPDGPFLDVQVSALPGERLLAALFGDPAEEESGRIALADEGALYLENADALPADVQELLVDGVRSGAFVCPATGRRVRSGPQLIVALQAAPEKLAAEGALGAAFLDVFPHVVETPTLRDRRDDIPELCERFLGELTREYAREDMLLAPETMFALLRYEWPGNVRELQRTLERLVLLTPGRVARLADLPAHFAGGEETEEEGIVATLRRFESTWLRRHLEEAEGDVARAAARLGMSEPDLRARLRQFGLL